jgi:hypothetical protein
MTKAFKVYVSATRPQHIPLIISAENEHEAAAKVRDIIGPDFRIRRVLEAPRPFNAATTATTVTTATTAIQEAKEAGQS